MRSRRARTHLLEGRQRQRLGPLWRRQCDRGRADVPRSAGRTLGGQQRSARWARTAVPDELRDDAHRPRAAEDDLSGSDGTARRTNGVVAELVHAVVVEQAAGRVSDWPRDGEEREGEEEEEARTYPLAASTFGNCGKSAGRINELDARRILGLAVLSQDARRNLCREGSVEFWPFATHGTASRPA